MENVFKNKFRNREPWSIGNDPYADLKEKPVVDALASTYAKDRKRGR